MTPAYRVTVDGRDISGAVRERLVSLEVADRSGLIADTLTLRLDDSDGLLALPRRGVAVSVALGYDAPGVTDMGEFVVDEVGARGPGHVLTVRARGADFRGALKQLRWRSWDETTLGAVARDVAAGAGLEAAVAGGLAAVALAHIDQTGESDAHFLTRLARRYGAALKLRGARLALVVAGSGKTASGRSAGEVTLRPEDVAEWRLLAEDRDRYGAARARWWDWTAAAPQTVEAGGGADGPALVLPELFASAAEAGAAAGAALAAARSCVACRTVAGRPELRAGAKLRFAGFREGLAGAWVVTAALQRVDAAGYATRVEAETASP